MTHSGDLHVRIIVHSHHPSNSLNTRQQLCSLTSSWCRRVNRIVNRYRPLMALLIANGNTDPRGRSSQAIRATCTVCEDELVEVTRLCSPSLVVLAVSEKSVAKRTGTHYRCFRHSLFTVTVRTDIWRRVSISRPFRRPLAFVQVCHWHVEKQVLLQSRDCHHRFYRSPELKSIQRPSS